MPRDGSGVYTLPVGNPVVTNTIIASTWANTTLSDIAAQLNNVLTRDGLLGPTGPFKLQDGTVNAPGLAWASEAGLGWYRLAAGQAAMAAGGRMTFNFDAASTTNSVLAVNPRANGGGAGLRVSNGFQGSADYLTMLITCNQGGYAVSMGAGGAAVNKPMFFAGATAYTFDQAVTATRFGLPGGSYYMGEDAGTEYLNFSPNWFFGWNKTNGTLLWNAGPSGPQSIFSPNGDFQAGGSIRSAGNQGPALRYDGSTANYLHMQGGSTGAWSFQWDRSNGTLRWLNTTGPVWSLDGNGATSQNGGCTAENGGFFFGASGRWWKIVREGNYTRQYFGNQATQRFDWDEGTGNFSIANQSGMWTFRSDAGFVTPGQGYKPGGGAWGDSSDERVKENIEPYTTGLDAICALEPVSYTFKPETGRGTQRYIRVLAQQAKQAMPELVTVAPGELGELKFDDLHTLDESPVLWALVNAVKTLNQRIAQLEIA